MSDIIQDGKYVEVNYQVIDEKTGNVLIGVEYPIGYVQGTNTILARPVMMAMLGKTKGDVIEVPIDCNELYGPRDESLVITDYIENVPEEYREVGTTIVMENDKGQTKSFLVTRVDEKTVTIDGNNPLCGREVIFKMNILLVRDATEEEVEIGGKVGADPRLEEILQQADRGRLN